MMTILPLRAAAAALAVLLLASACTGTDENPGAPTTASPSSTGAAGPVEDADYVALGDSFSAGPLVGTVRSDPSGCGRSTSNYPAFLADWLDVASYRDVTCSGAATTDLRGSQEIFGGGTTPPQLDALSQDTDLVTVGIGGNDFSLFSRLTGCVRQREGAGACSQTLPQEQAGLVRDAGRVERRVTRALARVRDRAPQAEVVLVGYPRLLPAEGTCDAAGIGADAAAVANRVAARLEESLRAAADASDAEYVSLVEPSTGHDICAGPRAWVNGQEVQLGRAAPFHPFVSGMRGAATAVFTALTGEQPPAGEVAAPDPGSVVRNDTAG
jgi:lysophospholipase L1-like esterase